MKIIFLVILDVFNILTLKMNLKLKIQGGIHPHFFFIL